MQGVPDTIRYVGLFSQADLIRKEAIETPAKLPTVSNNNPLTHFALARLRVNDTCSLLAPLSFVSSLNEVHHCQPLYMMLMKGAASAWQQRLLTV
eukprot:1864827-Amphidinium_carterae.1